MTWEDLRELMCFVFVLPLPKIDFKIRKQKGLAYVEKGPRFFPTTG